MLAMDIWSWIIIQEGYYRDIGVYRGDKLKMGLYMRALELIRVAILSSPLYAWNMGNCLV